MGARIGQLFPILTPYSPRNGIFAYVNKKVPTDSTGFDGYSRPSALASDPIGPRTIVGAGVDAGVFVSKDQALTWVPERAAAGKARGCRLPAIYRLSATEAVSYPRGVRFKG